MFMTASAKRHAMARSTRPTDSAKIVYRKSGAMVLHTTSVCKTRDASIVMTSNNVKTTVTQLWFIVD